MDTGYTYDEAVRIINHYSQRLLGLQITTSRTPQLNRISGIVQGFVPLPFIPDTQSYELFVFHYQMATHKDEWLQARQREAHHWLPFVILSGEYLPLVPILAELFIWDENWRA